PVVFQNTEIWPFLADIQLVRFVPERPSDPSIPYDEAFADLLEAVRSGHTRHIELQALRGVRLGPPFDLEQLPQPPQFIGRGDVLNWALEQLAPASAVESTDQVDSSGLAAIAALNGLGGIGKSALVGQIIRILFAQNEFPDGIAVEPCNGLFDAETVLRQVLS